MGFIVHRPGIHSLLVNCGRSSTRHLGIPMGGPADRAAWTIGNALVGNHIPFFSSAQRGEKWGVDALEMTLHGPILEATASHKLVVFGADLSTKVIVSTRAVLRSVSVGHTFDIEAGQLVSIGGASNKGLRAYLCVAGGWIGCPSVSQPIQVGEKLECSPGASTPSPWREEGRGRGRWAQIDSWSNSTAPGVLRYLADRNMSKKKRSHLENTPFIVRSESNRMGLRLESAQEWDSEKEEILSAPVVPGTIQLPGGGQPIVLGVDAQTIGGYPRLGYVISADLDQMAQIRPGDSIRFESTTVAQAERLRQDREEWLRGWVDRLHWQQIG
jgi:antagonist of KipI